MGRDGRISTFQPLSAFHKTRAPADGGPQASISSDKTKNESPFRTFAAFADFFFWGAGDSADPTGFGWDVGSKDATSFGGSKFSSPSETAINRKSQCGFNVCGFINNCRADHIDLSWQEVSMRNCESRSCNRIESWPIAPMSKHSYRVQFNVLVYSPFHGKTAKNNTRNTTKVETHLDSIFSSSFRVCF